MLDWVCYGTSSHTPRTERLLVPFPLLLFDACTASWLSIAGQTGARVAYQPSGDDATGRATRSPSHPPGIGDEN